MSSDIASSQSVLNFWIEAGPSKWFRKDGSFDDEIRSKFLTTFNAARNRELRQWESEPDSAMALILVLDQFSRNLYRDSDEAFAQDAYCLDVVKAAMESGLDRRMPQEIAEFCYMPLMHSEDLGDQENCIEQMQRLGLEETVKFAIIHRDIIKQFGRFPHRNAVLGRTTTEAEQAFLEAGGFSG